MPKFEKNSLGHKNIQLKTQKLNARTIKKVLPEEIMINCDVLQLRWCGRKNVVMSLPTLERKRFSVAENHKYKGNSHSKFCKVVSEVSSVMGNLVFNLLKLIFTSNDIS